VVAGALCPPPWGPLLAVPKNILCPNWRKFKRRVSAVETKACKIEKIIYLVIFMKSYLLFLWSRLRSQEMALSVYSHRLESFKTLEKGILLEQTLNKNK
jgi:hypothetical protein